MGVGPPSQRAGFRTSGLRTAFHSAAPPRMRPHYRTANSTARPSLARLSGLLHMDPRPLSRIERQRSTRTTQEHIAHAYGGGTAQGSPTLPAATLPVQTASSSRLASTAKVWLNWGSWTRTANQGLPSRRPDGNATPPGMLIRPRHNLDNLEK